VHSKFLKRVSFYPFLKTSMRRTAGTNAGAIQGIPFAASTQHEQNAFMAARSLTRGLWQPSGCGLHGGKPGVIQAKAVGNPRIFKAT
jgi:hypothetical protein